MTRRILIIDAIATRRIMMKAKLSAAQYDVVVAADRSEAAVYMGSGTFDIIFVDAGLDDDEEGKGAISFCQTIKADAATRSTPIIMISDPAPETRIIAAFEAGFEEVILRPLNERVLLAQLRALMRGLSSGDRSGDDIGLCDLPGKSKDTPSSAPRIAVIASSLERAHASAADMSTAFSSHKPPKFFARDFVGIIATLRDEPDLDAVLLIADAGREEAALTLLSDLRSRGAACEAGLIISLDDEKPTFAARAFDLGANNVVVHNTGSAELAFRSNRLAKAKRSRDALRLKVRDGLRMAITDPLTGVYNRRFATEKLEQITESAEEFALLMLDLDHFKKINDMHGHAVGDQVLMAAAQALKANLRDTDLLARMGGEEFLIALPGASAAQAISTAERLRAIIDNLRIRTQATDLPVKVTMSVGVTHNSDRHLSVGALMISADAALYRAKSRGRNMVSVGKAA